MTPLSKEKEVLLEVIELYKDMSFLWDKQHIDYKNRELRHEGNEALLEVYKRFDSNASLKTLVKKIQNLRTSYFKELKKVKESILTGAGTNDVYVPSLWYFDAMSFIGSANEPCLLERDKMETEEVLSSSSSEAKSVRRSMSASTSPSPQKRRRVTKISFLQGHKSLSNTAGKLHMKAEKWEIIGKAIGLQLKDLDTLQFFIAQKLIHDTVYYAQMGLLTEHSSVVGIKSRID